MYYKIVQNGNIIGAGFHFLRWFQRSGKFAFCDINQAQCVKDVVTDQMYHADWLKNVPVDAAFRPQEAEVVIIELNEFDDIVEELMDGEPIPEPVPEPEPEPTPEPEPEPTPEPEGRMTVQEMREKILEQESTIEMLTECLLEMSEIVYGGEL